MAEKIEVKVKAKNNSIPYIEYKGSNRIRVRHYIEKGTTKIYVYPENLSMAEEELKKNNLEYTIGKIEKEKEDANENTEKEEIKDEV